MRKTLVFCLLAIAFTTMSLESTIASDYLSWEKYENNPIVVPSRPNYQTTIRGKAGLRDEAGYKLYYTHMNYNDQEIHLATSPDGDNWTVSPFNPVIPNGVQSWSNYNTSIISVVKVNDVYYAFYNGAPANMSQTSSIGIATSLDGETWVPYSGNPVIPYSSIPPGNIKTPGGRGVVYKDGLFHIYIRSNELADWLYATSTDGITWDWVENVVIDLPLGGNKIQFDGSHLWAMTYIDRDHHTIWQSIDGMHWEEAISASLLPWQAWQGSQGYSYFFVDKEKEVFRL